MGRFTVLEHAQLAHLASEFSLGALHEFQPIAAGTVNSNFRIETDAGRYFLRVNEGKALDEVAYEVAVLTHLAEAGVATPLPLESSTGHRYATLAGKYVSVFPWREGHHADGAARTVAICRAIGQTLAHLHGAGRGMVDAREGRYTFEAMVRAYEKFASSSSPELSEAIAVLGEEISWLRARSALRAALPSGLIHADLFPDNVLMKSGAVVALLDFEQACVGSYCYDLAVCVNAWCFDEGLIEERAVALVAGYDQIRPLTEAEVVGLEAELRASALRFTVTRIRDVHLPAAGSPYQGKDFRRFLMRLQSWQDLGALGIADLAKAAKAA